MIQLILLLFVSSKAQAFPEMIRHNYTNCTTCHVSPTGGGLLNAYGRSLSKELLSRWSTTGEENLLHGAIQDENVINWVNGTKDVGFNIGGDLRFIEVFQEDSTVERARFFPMQREIEAAFKVKNLTVASTLGPQYNPRGPDEIDTRRLYALYQVIDSLSVRVGRFMPLFGINLADHFVNVKRGLGFDQGNERDTAELNYIAEKWNATVTYSKSPRSVADSIEEKAVAAQANYIFKDSYRVGVSYWNGDFEGSKRSIYGMQAMAGFTPEFYFLNEIDYQVRSSTSGDQEGVFSFQRLGYEVTRGVHLFLQYDSGQSDLDSGATRTYAYGAGFNFYPRPHFEIQGLLTKMTVNRPVHEDTDFSYLILHYYF